MHILQVVRAEAQTYYLNQALAESQEWAMRAQVFKSRLEPNVVFYTSK